MQRMPALGKINSDSPSRVIRVIDHELLSQRLGDNIGGYICSIAKSLDVSIQSMRKSSERLGVFRYDSRNGICRIAVRWDIEDELLLLVLCHELGHAMVWRAYGRKAKPHGKEWKFSVKQILGPAIALFQFSGYWENYAQLLMLNPRATYKTYEIRSLESNTLFVKDISPNSIFVFKNKSFKKGPLRRTRFLCECCTNRRQYAFDAYVSVSQG